MRTTEAPLLVLRVVTYPIVTVVRLVIYILHWIISPFLYFGGLAKELFVLPLRFLSQFEALWLFLGWAILVGTILGCLLYGVLKVFILVFDLDRSPVPKPVPATGHDAVSYRAAREDRKRKEQEKEERRAMRARLLASQPLIQEVVREAKSRPINLSSPVSSNTSTAATRSGLFQDIILEQTDEESESSYGA